MSGDAHAHSFANRDDDFGRLVHGGSRSPDTRTKQHEAKSRGRLLSHFDSSGGWLHLGRCSPILLTRNRHSSFGQRSYIAQHVVACAEFPWQASQCACRFHQSLSAYRCQAASKRPRLGARAEPRWLPATISKSRRAVSLGEIKSLDESQKPEGTCRDPGD